MEANDLSTLKKALDDNLKNNILLFWINKTIDDENGGFVGFVDAENKIDFRAKKNIILNSRILWTFSASYLFLKNNEYLKLADRAYIYLKNKFKDQKFGGVYWDLDYKGNPINKRKQVYAQAFTIYALAEYYKINKNEEALKWAKKIYYLIEKYSYDKVLNGYIEAFGEEWNDIENVALSEKEGNEKKTMNTHLHILEAYTNLFRIWPDKQLNNSLTILIQVFLKYFINKQYHLNLFFTDDWKITKNIISYGHDIECSWLLFEAAEIINNKKLISETKNIAVNMSKILISEGIDKNGGIYNDNNLDKLYLDTDKHWWVQAEGLVGLFNAYEITKEQIFIVELYKLWNFIDQYIIDHKNGEWYWKVDNNGNPSTSEEKAGPWKCPYHNSRACIEVIQRIDKL